MASGLLSPVCAPSKRFWPLSARTGVVTAAPPFAGITGLNENFSGATFAAPGDRLAVSQPGLQSLFAHLAKPGASLAAPEKAEPVSQFAQLMHSLGTGDHIPNLRMIQ